MKSYKDFAINTKLTLLVLLAGGVALSLSCIAFVTNDVRLIRSSMVKQMSALADVLGANSTAALNFDDPTTATELLTSLEKQPAVELACIYDVSGREFATYHGRLSNSQAPPVPTQEGYTFTDEGYLDVAQTIDHDGQPIGTIYLHASMDELQDQLLHYVNIVAIVMAVSLGASILLSSRLQRVISVPILRLAEAAQRISIERNYSIRVTKSTTMSSGSCMTNSMRCSIKSNKAKPRSSRRRTNWKSRSNGARRSSRGPIRISAGKSRNGCGRSKSSKRSINN